MRAQAATSSPISSGASSVASTSSRSPQSWRSSSPAPFDDDLLVASDASPAPPKKVARLSVASSSSALGPVGSGPSWPAVASKFGNVMSEQEHMELIKSRNKRLYNQLKDAAITHAALALWSQPKMKKPAQFAFIEKGMDTAANKICEVVASNAVARAFHLPICKPHFLKYRISKSSFLRLNGRQLISRWLIIKRVVINIFLPLWIKSFVCSAITDSCRLLPGGNVPSGKQREDIFLEMRQHLWLQQTSQKGSL